MFTNLLRLVRLLVVGVFLLGPASPAEAGRRIESPAETAAEPKAEADPAVGVAAIALGVAVFVFLAWAAARTSGGSQPANDIPG